MFNPYPELYGNFTRRNFSEIFPDEDSFINCPVEIEKKLSDKSMKNLYYLLYARYGSSTIAFDTESQFIYALFSVIFMYGPTWEKRLEIQDEIRKLNVEDGSLLEGAKYISNLALNPSTEGATGGGNDDLAPISTVNQQSYNGWKKNKLQAYGEILEIMRTDVSERFIAQFKKLFITVVQPNLPLWFE